MAVVALVIVVLLAIHADLVENVCCENGTKLLLVSMDGFRWDYVKTARTPNFRSLAARGVFAEHINSSFVTKTFPNHYTIATGLYEESHGIISNRMYDPVFDQKAGYGSIRSKWWEGEPIWVTARRQGLKSATYFWPGSEWEINGFRPNYWVRYNKKHKFKRRVDKVMQWLTKDNVTMATLYFHEPDSTGHRYGPGSRQVREKVEEMDNMLGYIMEQFTSNNLWATTNLIVTSDHGMADMDLKNKIIDISKIISIKNDINFTLDSGAFMQIFPKTSAIDIVDNLNSPNLEMTAYLKENIPEIWHYKNHRRIAPIIIVANEGWAVVKTKPTYSSKGTHGYDNNLQSMKPIFYAAGPSFKTGYGAGPFHVVDIYPLMCKILGIDPAPNNGSLSHVMPLLLPEKTTEQEVKQKEIKQNKVKQKEVKQVGSGGVGTYFSIIFGILCHIFTRVFRVM
ncbi:hypothetical protein FSP39_025474 [Pinctada imbricata]|uniref:Uncharacterized protein n=1 Tax=Pinctada imbricata TaxID=66713 RepID=A0AA88Y472_PINIB|nr:hypothetical protein FSP39_025474 [Pinctada imbricata]